MKQQKTGENKYIPADIEAKWQEKWESDKVFSPDIKNAKDPYFNLMMFPYPSAEGLHVGNMYAFTGADVYAKFNRMQGKDVLEPIGLDGFGIHSENYALKVGRHPKEQATLAEKNFYRQMRSIGNSFDWQRTVETYNPNYYKWTQWLFITLFKAGLAYRDTALVNWCPKDLTVLSDEQVIDGCCERCGTKVEKKNLEQWFFRITKYADRLLQNIGGLDWSNKVKIAQTNWIGKSEGAEVEFRIKGQEVSIKVFTTRPDTLYGATFMVIAPEHALVEGILNSQFSVSNETIEEIREYVEKVKDKTDIERTGEGKDKTGVFSGLYAINPVKNEEIPVWIADYVLSGYGTGAIMAVPAHDERDFAFAKKYNLSIVPVILNETKDLDSSAEPQNDNIEEAYVGPGRLINSGEWDGFKMPEDMSKVLEDLERRKLGVRKSNFHLRDWLISRQRYWGPPIPMIFCSNCQKNGKAEVEGMEGWFSVPEADLPVLLPDVEDWKPMGTGKAPLANHPEFYKTTCPSCGGDAERETDVSDTFLDSSWYFLRYPSTDISTAPFDIESTRKWLPVNMYIGGAEHSVLHLLYSRFVTMVLSDLGYLNFEEPFSTFFAHGLIIKDGAKMSKSKGNVVVPDEYIGKYGADTLRTYLMFIGPYSDGGDFRDSGIEGMNRFLRKVWKLFTVERVDPDVAPPPSASHPLRLQWMHKTIQGVTKDIKEFGYNTAIAKLMEWYNFLNQEVRVKNQELSSDEVKTYLKLLAPFAPHMTEELWQELGFSEEGLGFSSIHLQAWPEFDEKHLVSSSVVIPVQINGKRRGEIEVNTSELEDKGLVEAKAKESVAKNLEGQTVKKVIYVPGKIVNFVI
jgi:leucyl-tRNA synthetase